MGNTGSSYTDQFDSSKNNFYNPQSTGSYSNSSGYQNMMRNLYGNLAQRATQVQPSSLGTQVQSPFANLASSLLKGKQAYNLYNMGASASAGASGFVPGAAPVGYGAMDAGAGMGTVAAGTSPGIMAALPGIGQAMAAMYGVGKLAEWGIPKLDRLISGPSRYLQEIPTEEIRASYTNEGGGSGGVAPVWAELQRRGATTGLNAPTGRDMNLSYINKADMTPEAWKAFNEHWANNPTGASFNQGPYSAGGFA